MGPPRVGTSSSVVITSINSGEAGAWLLKALNLYIIRSKSLFYSLNRSFNSLRTTSGIRFGDTSNQVDHFLSGTE